MEILLLVGLVLAGVVAIYLYLLDRFNAYAWNRYSYTPVSLGKSALMILPIFAGCLGWIFLHTPSRPDLTHPGVTGALLIGAAAVAVALIFWEIKRNTSLGIALATLAILLINSFLIVIGIVGLIALHLGRRETRQYR